MAMMFVILHMDLTELLRTTRTMLCFTLLLQIFRKHYHKEGFEGRSNEPGKHEEHVVTLIRQCIMTEENT